MEFLKNAVVDLGNTIINGLKSVFEFLFVPSNNLFDDVAELFNEKFGIFSQIADLVESLHFTDDDTKPSFNITLYGNTMPMIDFSMFDKYRTFVHNLILMISYFKFVIWVVNNAPAVITGTGGSLSSKGGSDA